MAKDDDEEEKLKSMVKYGLNHNAEHRAEIREWAKSAKELDKPEAHDSLVSASEKLGQVIDHLGRALEELNREED
ncbi:hypothetical protein K9M78_02590 [Candidatus Bipolaricaulota bacterium]|nr:hypothetical protein [Candidatus Bipolaricaulota bacterium]